MVHGERVVARVARQQPTLIAISRERVILVMRENRVSIFLSFLVRRGGGEKKKRLVKNGIKTGNEAILTKKGQKTHHL